MRSNKPRRPGIKLRRAEKRLKSETAQARVEATARAERLKGQVLVRPELLKQSNCYQNDPIFVERGYYEDRPFVCKDCGSYEVWTAKQQKWWYEIAKGDVWTGPRRCRPCRRRERERLAEVRRVYSEGLARKMARRN